MSLIKNGAWPLREVTVFESWEPVSCVPSPARAAVAGLYLLWSWVYSWEEASGRRRKRNVVTFTGNVGPSEIGNNFS